LAYRIEIGQTAQRALRKLPADIRRRIGEAIEKLADEQYPQGVKKLTNRPGWRVRIGEYRVIYTVDDDERLVRIWRVAHRREVYR
jgi:mRNA interferase RelE/StbE